MLRLTTIFLIWMASTACALEEGDADYDAADFDAELHEAYVSRERAAELRRLLDKYERSYYSAADVDRGEAHSGRNQR
jgi:hypothetical protein